MALSCVRILVARSPNRPCTCPSLSIRLASDCACAPFGNEAPGLTLHGGPAAASICTTSSLDASKWRPFGASFRARLRRPRSLALSSCASTSCRRSWSTVGSISVNPFCSRWSSRICWMIWKELTPTYPSARPGSVYRFSPGGSGRKSSPACPSSVRSGVTRGSTMLTMPEDRRRIDERGLSGVRPRHGQAAHAARRQRAIGRTPVTGRTEPSGPAPPMKA